MVSGSLSLPSPGFFSPFPHGTRPLSVAAQYLALDRGRPGFGQGFTCPALLRIPPESRPFRIRGCHALRRSFPEASPTDRFSHNSSCGPTTPLMWFGLFPVRSPLLGESLLISLPGLLRWFTSPSIAPASYVFRCSGDSISAAGLLHSEIRGSQDMCSSPRLIAAYHVLLRLAAPRHPPWTCIRLTILSSPLCASFRTPGLLPSSFPRFALAAQAFLHPRMLFCTRVRFLPLYISNFFRQKLYQSPSASSTDRGRKRQSSRTVHMVLIIPFLKRR